MKKQTKGAIAGGIAAVLLLGGASTLAYWSDTANGDGGTISSGDLSLTAGTASEWTYAGTSDAVGTIVPGDSIEKTIDFTITAKGDHIQAALDTPATINATVTSTPEPTTMQLDVDSSFQVEGADAPATITAANDGDVVTATITVDFPYGSGTVNGNDTKNLEASLDEITVSLTQVDPNV